MNLENFFTAWNNYFHPTDPSVSISIFRIFLGICCLSTFVYSMVGKKFFSRDGFYGEEFRRDTDFAIKNILDSFKNLNLFFFIGFIASLFLTIGFLTQLTCIFLVFWFNQLVNRNPYLFHSGHTTISISLFMLVFSHADTFLSVDSFLGINVSFPSYTCFSVLLKLQVAFVLLSAYVGKVFIRERTFSWLDGSALYYSLQHPTYARASTRKIFNKDRLPFIKYLGLTILFSQLIIALSAPFPDLSLIAFFFLFFMQLSFAIFLKLGIFPWIYIGLSFLFIPNEVFYKYLVFLL